MSRFYELIVKVKGVDATDVENVIEGLSDWSVENCSIINDVVTTTAKGYLYAGETEAGVHDEICAAVIKINPKVRVGTRWVYLEDLPFTDYGDDEIFV